jgi:hypothetical protein
VQASAQHELAIFALGKIVLVGDFHHVEPEFRLDRRVDGNEFSIPFDVAIKSLRPIARVFGVHEADVVPVVDAPVAVEPEGRAVDVAEGVAPVEFGAFLAFSVGADLDLRCIGERAKRDLERLLRELGVFCRGLAGTHCEQRASREESHQVISRVRRSMDRHGHTSIQTLVVVERLSVMRRYTAPALSGVYREIACGYATVFRSLPLFVFAKP